MNSGLPGAVPVADKELHVPEPQYNIGRRPWPPSVRAHTVARIEVRPDEVLVACVAENRPEWWERVWSLVLSLREYGGALSRSPVNVCFVGSAEPLVTAGLRSLDASVRVVSPYPGPYLHANKIRMLEAEVAQGTKYLLALDCDTVVVGDPSGGLSTSALRAKPTDRSHLSRHQWRRLLDQTGITEPGPEAHVTTSDGSTAPVPYVNSGVLFVPGPLREPLREAWGHELDLFPELVVSLPWLERLLFSADQIALSLALLRTGIRLDPLPVSYNFPTHLPVDGPVLEAAGMMRILHYHGRTLGRGTIAPPVEAVALEASRRFNRLLACRRPPWESGS